MASGRTLDADDFQEIRLMIVIGGGRATLVKGGIGCKDFVKYFTSKFRGALLGLKLPGKRCLKWLNPWVRLE